MRVTSFFHLKKMLVLLLLLLSASVWAAHSGDSTVLSKIYSECGGEKWSVEDSLWMTGNPVHDWKGVTLNAEGRVVELNMSHFGLNGDLPWDMKDLDSLVKLTAQYNSYLYYAPFSLSYIKTLKHVDFAHCRFTKIFEGGVTWESLEYLDLSHNIGDWDSENYILIDQIRFDNMPNLKFVNLRFNRSHSFPRGLKCDTLDMSGNYLRDLSTYDLGSYSTISKIDVSRCSIREFFDISSSNSSIKYLDLSHNFLEDLNGEDFSKLSALETILLDSNDFEMFPIELYNESLPLKTLSLKWNGLDSLESNKKLPKSLISLNLHNTSFESVSNTFTTANSLQYLDISGNNFPDMSFEILNSLVALKHLNVSKCNIYSFSDSLKGLANLETLDLSYNYLKDIMNIDLPALQEVLLDSNLSIKSLPATFFSSNLRKISFDNCKVWAFPETFSTAKYLEYLSFKNNRIKHIPDGIISFVNLDTLYMEGNYYGCNSVSYEQGVLDFLNVKVLDGKNANLDLCMRHYDSLELVSFYKATNGGNWTNNTNWLSEAPIDEWFGVTMNGERLDSIVLPKNNVTGTLYENLYLRTKLYLLDLQDNNISQLGTNPVYAPADTSRNTDEYNNLRVLNLSKNMNMFIYGTFLGNAINLDSLEMDSCGLLNFPNGLWQCKDLFSLSLDYNKIEDISDSIELLDTLRYLKLDNNKLTSLNPKIGNIKTLNTVSFSQNPTLNLKTLPEWLKELPILNTLGASEVGLEEIPEWIGELTQIGNLWFPDNNIKSVPASIGRLTNLRVLQLLSNEIEELPSTIMNLKEISPLDGYGPGLTVSDNKLCDVPHAIQDYLDLNGEKGWDTTQRCFNCPEIKETLKELQVIEKQKLEIDLNKLVDEKSYYTTATSKEVSNNDWQIVSLSNAISIQQNVSSNKVTIIPGDSIVAGNEYLLQFTLTRTDIECETDTLFTRLKVVTTPFVIEDVQLVQHKNGIFEGSFVASKTERPLQFYQNKVGVKSFIKFGPLTFNGIYLVPVYVNGVPISNDKVNYTFEFTTSTKLHIQGGAFTSINEWAAGRDSLWFTLPITDGFNDPLKKEIKVKVDFSAPNTTMKVIDNGMYSQTIGWTPFVYEKVNYKKLEVIPLGINAPPAYSIILSDEQVEASQVTFNSLQDSREYEYRLYVEDSLGNEGISSIVAETFSDYYSISGKISGKFRNVSTGDIKISVFKYTDSSAIGKGKVTITEVDDTTFTYRVDSLTNGEYFVNASVTDYKIGKSQLGFAIDRKDVEHLDFNVYPYPIVAHDGVRVVQQEGTGDLHFYVQAQKPLEGEFPSKVVLSWVPDGYSKTKEPLTSTFEISSYTPTTVNDSLTLWRFVISRDEIDTKLSKGELSEAFLGRIRYVGSHIETKLSHTDASYYRMADWSYPTHNILLDGPIDGSIITLNSNLQLQAPQWLKPLMSPLVSPPVTTDNAISFAMTYGIHSSGVKAYIKVESEDSSDAVSKVVRESVVDMMPIVPAQKVGNKTYSTGKINWYLSSDGYSGKEDMYGYVKKPSSSNPDSIMYGKGIVSSIDTFSITTTETGRSYCEYGVQVGTTEDTLNRYALFLDISNSSSSRVGLRCELYNSTHRFNFEEKSTTKTGWIKLDDESYPNIPQGEYTLRIYAPTTSCEINGFSVTNNKWEKIPPNVLNYYNKLGIFDFHVGQKSVDIKNLPKDRLYSLHVVLKDRFGNISDTITTNGIKTNDTYDGGDLSIGQIAHNGELQIAYKTPEIIKSGALQKHPLFPQITKVSISKFIAYIQQKEYVLIPGENKISGSNSLFTFSKEELKRSGLLDEPDFAHNALYDSVGFSYNIQFIDTTKQYYSVVLESKPVDSTLYAPVNFTCDSVVFSIQYKTVTKYINPKDYWTNLSGIVGDYKPYQWTEQVPCTTYTYYWSYITTAILNYETPLLTTYWPDDKGTYYSSQEYRTPASPIFNTVDVDARNAHIKCSMMNLNQNNTPKEQMSGTIHAAWEPGSLCQDSTVIEIPFGNCFYQNTNGDFLYAPTFYGAVESDMGSWVSIDTSGTLHQWVDSKNGKGGAFYPNIGYEAPTSAIAKSGAPYISHRVFVDEEDAGHSFTLWLLSEEPFGETSNDVFVEVMAGISNGRESHFDATTSEFRKVSITGTSWIYGGTFTMAAGYNTVSLFMCEDGLTVNGVALTKGSIKPTITSASLPEWDSNNGGFEIDLIAKDLPSNQDINFSFYAVDRFGNRSENSHHQVRTGSVNQKLPELILTPHAISGDFFSNGSPLFEITTDGHYANALILRTSLQRNGGGHTEDISTRLTVEGDSTSMWKVGIRDSFDLYTHPLEAVTPSENYTLLAQIYDSINDEQSDWVAYRFGVNNDSTNIKQHVVFDDPHKEFNYTLGSNLKISFFAAYVNSDGTATGKMQVLFDGDITEDVVLIENVIFTLVSEVIDSTEEYTGISSYDLTNAYLSVYDAEMSKKNNLSIHYGKYRTEIPILDSLVKLDEANGHIIISEDGLVEGQIYDDNSASVRFSGLQIGGNYTPLTLNSRGYTTSLLATKDNFYINNVQTFVPDRDGFSFTSCVTIFEKAGDTYSITAARECDGCDDSLSGPFLTYSVLDPKHGGVEFEGYDPLKHPMSITYKDTNHTYQLHWSELTDGVNPILVPEEKQKEIEYRNWSMVPYSYTFSDSGLQIDSFALNMYQSPLLLENDTTPVRVDGFSSLMVTAAENTHNGNLFVKGNASATTPTEGLVLEMEGGYRAYLSGTLALNVINEGVDYELVHTGSENSMSIDLPVYHNKILSTSGDLNSAFHSQNGEDIVNVTLDTLKFDYRRITALSGNSGINLAIGKVINIIGNVSVEFLSGFFDITITPIEKSEGVLYVIPNEESFLAALIDQGVFDSIEISPNSASLALYEDLTVDKINNSFDISSKSDFNYSSIDFTSLKIDELSYNSFLIKSLQLSKAVISNQTSAVSSVIPQLIPSTYLYADLVLKANNHSIQTITSLSDIQIEQIAGIAGVTTTTIPDGYDIKVTSDYISSLDTTQAELTLKKATLLVTMLLQKDRTNADNYLKNTLKLDTKTLRTALEVDKSSVKFGPDFSIYSLYGLVNLKQLENIAGSIVPPEYKDVLDIPIDGIEISTIRKRGEKKLMLALLNPQVNLNKLFKKDNNTTTAPSNIDLYNFAIDQDLELQALNGKISLGKLQEKLRSNVGFLENISDKVFKLSMNDLFVSFGRKYSDSTTAESADLKLKTSGSIVLGEMFKVIGMNGETILLDKLAASYTVTKEDGAYVNKSWSLDTLAATAMPYARVIPLFGSATEGAPVELVSGGKSISMLYQRTSEGGGKSLDLKLQNWTLRFTDNFKLPALRGLSFHIDNMVYSVDLGTDADKGKITEFKASAVYVPPNKHLAIEDYGLYDVEIKLANDNSDVKTKDLGMYLQVKFRDLLVGGEPLGLGCGAKDNFILKVYLDGGFYLKACAEWKKNITIVPFGIDFDSTKSKVYLECDRGGPQLDLEIQSGKGFTGKLRDVKLKSGKGFFDKIDSSLNLDITVEEVGMCIKKDENGDNKFEVTKFDAVWLPDHDFLKNSDNFSLTLDAVRMGYTGGERHKGNYEIVHNGSPQKVEYDYSSGIFFMDGGLSFHSKMNDHCETSVSPILKFEYDKNREGDRKGKFDWRVDGMLKCEIGGMDFGATVVIDKNLVGFPMAYAGHDALGKLINGNKKMTVIADSVSLDTTVIDSSGGNTIQDSIYNYVKKKSQQAGGYKVVPDADLCGVVLQDAFWRKDGGSWSFDKTHFKVYPTFSKESSIKVPGIGIKVIGTFRFEDLFTKPRGISLEDVKVKLSDKMGGTEIPTGFSMTLNGKKPYLHPRFDMPNPITVPIPGISLTDDIEMSGAMMQLGYTESMIEGQEEPKKNWYFSGKGGMSLPGAIKNLTVEVGFEEANPPINFTGIHHAVITLKLAQAARIPLGTTPLYIAGFKGGLYDGTAIPQAASECGFNNMKPGLKMEAAMFLEFAEPELMQGSVGFWTHLMALNFGVNGEVSGLRDIYHAYACAALYNGGTAFHTKMMLTLGKGVIVQGEFTADAWKDYTGGNFTAEALARIGLKRASLVDRRILKIPRKDRMWGDFFANFGKFEGEQRGATTGIRLFKRSFGLGVINRKFVIGNMGKYRLKQAPLYSDSRSISRNSGNGIVAQTDSGAPILQFDDERYVLIDPELSGLKGHEMITIAGGVNKSRYEWPEHAFRIAYLEDGVYKIDTAVLNYTAPDEADSSGDLAVEAHQEPYNMKMRMWVNNRGADSVFLCVPALERTEQMAMRSRGEKETQFEYMLLAGLEPSVVSITVDTSGDYITFNGEVREFTPERVDLTVGEDNESILSQLSELKLFTSQIAPMDVNITDGGRYLSNMRPIALSEFEEYKDTYRTIIDFDSVTYDQGTRTLTITNLKWSKKNLGEQGGTFALAASVDLYDYVIYEENGEKKRVTSKSDAAHYRMQPVNLNETGSSDNTPLLFTMKTPKPTDKLKGLVATGSEATANWRGDDETRNIYVNWEMDSLVSGYEVSWFPKGKRWSLDTVHLVDSATGVDTTYVDTIHHVRREKIGKSDNFIISIPDVSSLYSSAKIEMPRPIILYDTIYDTVIHKVTIPGRFDTLTENGTTQIVPFDTTIIRVFEDLKVREIEKQEKQHKFWGHTIDSAYYFANEFEIVVTPYRDYVETVDEAFGEGEDKEIYSLEKRRFNLNDYITLADTVFCTLGTHGGTKRNELSIELVDSKGNPLTSDTITVVRNGSETVHFNVNISDMETSGTDASNYVGIFTNFAPVDSFTTLGLPSVGVLQQFRKITDDTISNSFTVTPNSKDLTCEEVFKSNCHKVKEQSDGTLDTLECGCNDDDEYLEKLDSLSLTDSLKLKENMSPCDFMDSLFSRKTPVGDYDLYIYAVNNGQRSNPTADEIGYSIVDTMTVRVLPPEPTIHGQNKRHFVKNRPDTLEVAVSGMNLDPNYHEINVKFVNDSSGAVEVDNNLAESMYSMRKRDVGDTTGLIYNGDIILQIFTEPISLDFLTKNRYKVEFSIINKETSIVDSILTSTSESIAFDYITMSSLIECNDTLHLDSSLSKYNMEWFGNYPSYPAIGDSMMVYFSELYEKNRDNFHIILNKYETASETDSVPVGTLVITDFEISPYSLRFKPDEEFLNTVNYYELVTNLKNNESECNNKYWGKGEKFKFTNNRSYEIDEVRRGDTVGFRVIPNNGYSGMRSDRIRYFIGNYEVNGGTNYKHYPKPAVIPMYESNTVTVVYCDKDGDNEVRISKFIRVDETPKLRYTNGDTVANSFTALPGDTIIISYKKDGFIGNFDNSANRAWYHFSGKEKVSGSDTIVLSPSDSGFVEIGVERLLSKRNGGMDIHNVGSRIYQVSIPVDSLVASSDMVVLPHGPIADALDTSKVYGKMITITIDSSVITQPIDSCLFRGANLQPIPGQVLSSPKNGKVQVQLVLDTLDGNRLDNRFYISKGVPLTTRLYEGYRFIAHCEQGDQLSNGVGGESESISLTTGTGVVGSALHLEGGDMPTMTVRDLVHYYHRALTFSQWIKLDTLTAGDIISFSDKAGRADMALQMSGTGALEFEVNGYMISSPDRTVEADAWLHIQATTGWGAVDDSMHILVNGVTVASGKASSERPYFSDSSDITIGTSLYGYVDEVSITSHNVSEKEAALDFLTMHPHNNAAAGYDGYSECLSLSKAERALRKGFGTGVKPYRNSNFVVSSSPFDEYSYLERPLSGDSVITLSFDEGAQAIVLLPEGEQVNVPAGFTANKEEVHLYDSVKQEGIELVAYEKTFKGAFTFGLDLKTSPAPILLVRPDSLQRVEWVKLYTGVGRIMAGDDPQVRPYMDRTLEMGILADSLQNSVVLSLSNSLKGDTKNIELVVDTFAAMQLWVDKSVPVDSLLLINSGWVPDTLTMEIGDGAFSSFSKARKPGLEMFPVIGDFSQSKKFSPFVTLREIDAPDPIIDTADIIDGLELDTLYRSVILYSDTFITCSQVSQPLEGLPFLRTKHEDFDRSDTIFDITLKYPSRIYCALDAAQETLPGFIRKQDSVTGSWVPHDSKVMVRNSEQATYTIYSKEFEAGEHSFTGHRDDASADNRFNYLLIFEKLASDTVDSVDIVKPYWGLKSKTLEVTGIGDNRAASSENFSLSNLQIVSGYGDSLRSTSWKMSATVTPSYVKRIDTLKVLSAFLDTVVVDSNGDQLDYIDVQDTFSLRDLLPKVINASDVHVSAQDLTVSGSVLLSFTNSGPQPVLDSFDVVLFEDNNGDYRYDPFYDRQLQTTTVAPISAGSTVLRSFALEGTISFPEKVLFAFIDAGYNVDEVNEQNNVIASSGICDTFVPADYLGTPVADSLILEITGGYSQALTARFLDLNGDSLVTTEDEDVLIYVKGHQLFVRSLRGDSLAYGGYIDFENGENLRVADVDGDKKPELFCGNLLLSNSFDTLFTGVGHLAEGYDFTGDAVVDTVRMIDSNTVVIDGVDGRLLYVNKMNNWLFPIDSGTVVELAQITPVASECYDISASFPRVEKIGTDSLGRDSLLCTVRVANSGSKELYNKIVTAIRVFDSTESMTLYKETDVSVHAVDTYRDVSFTLLVDNHESLHYQFEVDVRNNWFECNEANNRVRKDKGE